MIFQATETVAGWRDINDNPPEGVFVLTKIHDHLYGERNVQLLKRSGRLWFMLGGMYVYYTPTHWRPKERQ